MRTIEVPTLAARLYMGVMNLILQEFFDTYIGSQQFGFRSGKPGYVAWLAIIRLILYYKHLGLPVRIYELDLLGFFPNIHKRLLSETYSNQLMVPRRHIAGLKAFDSIPLLLQGELIRSSTGLPQGAATSPILSNLVLNELGLLDPLKGGSTIIHYADDCVIIGISGVVELDVLEYQSRLRDGVSISTEKSGWNVDGILKFIGFTLDLNTGIFSATPRSGENKIIDNIYICDTEGDAFWTKVRHAFVVDNIVTNDTLAVAPLSPQFRGITCNEMIMLLKNKSII
jgi:hypothetical protein